LADMLVTVTEQLFIHQSLSFEHIIGLLRKDHTTVFFKVLYSSSRTASIELRRTISRSGLVTRTKIHWQASFK
jgi:hypothetical protein